MDMETQYVIFSVRKMSQFYVPSALHTTDLEKLNFISTHWKYTWKVNVAL